MFQSVDVAIFLSILLFCTVIVYFFTNKPRGNHPPGPVNLPVIGSSLFLIREKPEELFSQLRQKYGDVVYMRVGMVPVVLLNSYSAIKEALVLNTETSVTRPTTYSNSGFLFNNMGLTVENGQIWKEQRRFLLSALKDLGIGKQNLEFQIRDEATNLVDEFQQRIGQAFDPQDLLRSATCNIISFLTFGKRYKFQDPVFHEIIDIHTKIMQGLSMRHPLNGYPFLRHILPESLSGRSEMRNIKQYIHQYMKLKIQEHSLRPSGEVFDYTDIYLQRQTRDKAHGVENSSFHNERLISNMIALSIAGTITSSAILYWAIKILIKFPSIQQRLHKEIDSVIGPRSTPSYSDRLNTSYMEPFLMELQRFASAAPSGAPHFAKVGTKLSGYDIPAGVTILTRLHSVHSDPTLWGDPENFCPERFIGLNGKCVKPEYWIPFGIGKRSCPGENLARTEIFLFLTNILQNFILSPASAEDLNMDIENSSVTRELTPFQIIAKHRYPY